MAGMVKAQSAQNFGQPAAFGIVDGEFQELHAIEHGGPREFGGPGFGFDEAKRPQTVARDQPSGGGSKLVVEHL